MTRFALALLAALAPVAHAAPIGALSAPELDGTGALAAIGLLAGVVAVVAERRRRK